jgi:uncharacterized protein (UPF0332 family)
MALSEIEKKDVVKFRLEKANNTFAEITILMQNELYRTATNRLYYACYYAATALLINNGYETHTHSGVKTLLGLHYIKGGKIDKSMGKMYNQLFNMRQDNDYEDWIDVDESDILPFIEPAKQFIETIEKLISKDSEI